MNLIHIINILVDLGIAFIVIFAVAACPKRMRKLILKEIDFSWRPREFHRQRISTGPAFNSQNVQDLEEP